MQTNQAAPVGRNVTTDGGRMPLRWDECEEFSPQALLRPAPPRTAALVVACVLFTLSAAFLALGWWVAGGGRWL